MISLLLSETWVQLHSCWLPITGEWHFLHLYEYLAMLVTVTTHSYHRWEMLFHCFLPLAACIVSSRTREARQQAFRSDPVLLSPVFKVPGVFSIMNLPSSCGKTKDNIIRMCLKSLKDTSVQQLKREFSHVLDWGFC